MTAEQAERDAAFFKKVLRRGLQDDTVQNVVLVEKEPAVKKGENYMSKLTRVTLEYDCAGPKGLCGDKVQNVAHLIMKEEPDASQQTLDFIRETNLFNIERTVLEEVVPRIEKLVGKRLAAKVFYYSTQPHVIVMEDLRALGFKNKDRKEGLNEQQVVMILENLADFHAASILLNEQDPQLVSRFTNGIFTDQPREAFFSYITSGLKCIADGIRDWPGGDFVSISDKLLRKSKNFVERLKQSYRCNDDELRALNHGDMWSNNMMIKDDESGVSNAVRFVDFQISVWTSPAIDLVYFLSIAPAMSIKMTHNDMFLGKYLNRLSSTMKRLDCSASAPSLDQLKKSMLERREYALMAGLVFWPKTISEDEDVEGVDTLLEKGESSVEPLKYPRVREVMHKILPILDQWGYLD